LALSTIAARWRLSHNDLQLPRVEPRMTLNPDKVRVRVECLERGAVGR